MTHPILGDKGFGPMFEQIKSVLDEKQQKEFEMLSVAGVEIVARVFTAIWYINVSYTYSDSRMREILPQVKSDLLSILGDYSVQKETESK